MRILVTGASGYVASYLIPRLRKDGHYIIGVDREKPATALCNEFTRADLLDIAKFPQCFEQIDLVCHLAAAKGDWGISESEYFRDNLEATQCLIDALNHHGISDVIFYSTVSVLGPSDTPLDETAAKNFINPYGASKAACEEVLTEFSEANPRHKIYTIRPSVIFGPNNPWNTNIYRLIEAIERNRFAMIGNGKNIKSTSYIENLVEAHIFLMDKLTGQHEAGHKIYHYIDQPALSVAEMTTLIFSILGKKHQTLKVPLGLAMMFAPVGDLISKLTGKDVPINMERVKKFCTGTNFQATKIRQEGFQQPTTCSDAFERTIEWHRTQKN